MTNIKTLSRSFSKGLEACISGKGNVVVLVGEGAAREAGVGKPKDWMIGDTRYAADILRTEVSFKRMWWEVWAWYAARAAIALHAEPCSAQHGVVDLLVLLGRICTAVSLTSDGLLRRAAVDAVDNGCSLMSSQVVETQGNITTMRCNNPQSPHPHEEFPLPELDSIPDWKDFTKRKLSQEESELLRCPLCMSPAKPSEPFHDAPQTTLAASQYFPYLATNTRLLLLLGCDNSADDPFQQSIIKSTYDNDGWVLRAGSPAKKAAGDVANALGQTGIRAKDGVQYTPTQVITDVQGIEEKQEAVHLGLLMSALVDVAEEVVAAQGKMPQVPMSRCVLRVQKRFSSWGYAPSSFDLGPRKLPDGMLDKDVADFLRWTLGTVQHVRVGQQRSAALAAALKAELKRLRDANYETGPQAYTQAITLLARWGRTAEARALLEEMKSRGLVINAEPYEELMKGHAMCGDLHGIQQVLREMNQGGWAITKQAYNYLLMGFSKRGEQSHAIKMLEAMKESGLQPDRMSYHWAIMACNNYTAARKIFDDMVARGIQYNDQTFSALLKTCMKAGDAKNGMTILMESIEDGLKPSSTVFNQVMRLHLKPLDMNAVAVIYRKMRDIGMMPDFVTYCIFVRACKLECRGGVKVDARSIALAEAGLEQARRDGCDHREVYRELLSLYNKVGDRKKAEDIATLMLKALPGDNRQVDVAPTVWA